MKLLALLLLATAPSGQQFDLVCTGTREINSIALGKKIEPYRAIYRVDLAKGRWCEDICLTTSPISDAQPNVLELQAPRRIDGPSHRETFISSIDRTTGEQRMLSFSNSKAAGMLDIVWEGHCDPRPFSGFPEGKAKF